MKKKMTPSTVTAPPVSASARAPSHAERSNDGAWKRGGRGGGGGGAYCGGAYCGGAACIGAGSGIEYDVGQAAWDSGLGAGSGSGWTGSNPSDMARSRPSSLDIQR